MSNTTKQLVVKYSPVTSVLIGGDLHQVYSYVLSTKNVRQKSEPKTTTGAIHYINILDRSGSMYRDIDDVIDQAQALFSQIRTQDFWSLIWFSSPGDFKVLLKGAQYSPKLGELLDTIRSVRGTTCFSDPIKETERTIDELSTIADNVVVTLFTDGCPVVTDVKAEMTLCQSLVTGMKKKIIAFNTIGFGNYYNREFMQSMSSCSEQGRYVHISNIREFEPVYRETAERARDMTNCPLTLKAAGAQILYQSGKTVLLKEEVLELDHVDLEDNRITVFVSDGKNSASILRVGESSHGVQLHGNGFSDIKERGIDGVVFKDEKCAPLAPEVIYAYASALYANKKTKRAREIVVRNMGDKRLADAITSSFTYAEMGSTSRMFEEAIVDEDARQINSCDASYIPAPDATCVMELLGVLADSQSKYVPFAYRSSDSGLNEAQKSARELLTPYKRVREKVVDTQDIFHSTPEEVQAFCTDIVYAEDRPNVSLRFTIPGTATLNARAASRVGLPEEYPVKRYQVHTFIKDGNLNVPHAEFVLDTTAYNYMVIRDVPHTVINKGEGRVIIHFEKMPVINENMMNDAMLNLSALATATKKMLENEAAQKVLRERIKSLHEKVGVSAEMTEDFAALNEDQIQVLIDHGIDKRSVYGGISKERIERTESSDFYMVREISLYPTGISSLPTVASVVKKMEDGKKLTPREDVIASALEVTEVAESIFNETALEARMELLNKMLDSCKSRLTRYRNELSRFKIAMCLNADFDSLSGLDFNDNGVAEFDGVVLTMKKVQQYV